MCFKNLPIEFDTQGKARLKPGAADPYSYAQGPLQIEDDRDRVEELCERYDSVCQVDVDRLTSVAGDIVVDLEALLDLVEQGCEPELAVRVVAPEGRASRRSIAHDLPARADLRHAQLEVRRGRRPTCA